MPDLFVSAEPNQRVKIKSSPFSGTTANPAIIDPTKGLIVERTSGDGSFVIDPGNSMNVFVIPPPVWTGADTVFTIMGDKNLGPDEDLLVNTVTLSALPFVATDLGLSADPAELQ